MTSLSRQLARWVVGLRFEDLPPAVIDRAKGVTLHGLASVLLGSQSADGRQAVRLMVEEEAGVRNGATIMVDGTRVTKGGAAFANAEMAMALFGPRITIFTKDGRSYTKQATGREFVWDFEEEARRIRGVVPGLPIPPARFEEIIATCRDLDRHDRAARLVELTLATP
jgi:hypothetical protein